MAESAANQLPSPTASAGELAAAAGAADLFVFRRVAGSRFAHVGGYGRGAGWAGIVEVDLESEPFAAAALSKSISRSSAPEPWRVVGPYYARSAVLARVSDDLFVAFGAPGEAALSSDDFALLKLARFAGETLTEVEPAKRLADEIETLTAVRDLLQAPAETFSEALQRLVDQTTSSLSCDLGIAHVPGRQVTAICDLRGGFTLQAGDALPAVEALLQRGRFPICVQQAMADELPEPFRSVDGVLAYYLLKVSRPLPGLLLLLHTQAASPRGFTLLCQRLGAQLVRAAEPLLTAALLRDTMQEQLDRASEQARREPLTGVGNRLAWSEGLASAVSTLMSPVSIIKVDCRGLKRINDTRGHHIGDQLLKQVAAILNASSREEDLVARLGGDEFGILLTEADGDVVRSVVDRIVRRAQESDIQLAIGIATTHTGDVEAADRRADLDMLHAKRGPRATRGQDSGARDSG